MQLSCITKENVSVVWFMTLAVCLLSSFKWKHSFLPFYLLPMQNLLTGNAYFSCVWTSPSIWLLLSTNCFPQMVGGGARRGVLFSKQWGGSMLPVYLLFYCSPRLFIIGIIFQCTKLWNPEAFIGSQLQLAPCVLGNKNPWVVICSQPWASSEGMWCTLVVSRNTCYFALFSVRSRNLLIYEEHSPLEEPSSSASAGELGRWDRGSSLLRASGLESRPDVDLPRFIISNETSLEKSVLLELQQHLWVK